MQGAQDKAQKHVAALRLRVAEHKQRSADSRRELRQAQRTIRAFEVRRICSSLAGICFNTHSFVLLPDVSMSSNS